MKVVAIGDRGSRKDFYDLYGILTQTPLSAGQILNDVLTKYNLRQDKLYHYIKALTYFEDAAKTPDIQSMLRRKAAWDDVEDFFRNLAKKTYSISLWEEVTKSRPYVRSDHFRSVAQFLNSDCRFFHQKNKPRSAKIQRSGPASARYLLNALSSSKVQSKRFLATYQSYFPRELQVVANVPNLA